MSQDHLLRRPTLETFGLWSKFNQTTGPSTDVVEDKKKSRGGTAASGSSFLLLLYRFHLIRPLFLPRLWLIHVLWRDSPPSPNLLIGKPIRSNFWKSFFMGNFPCCFLFAGLANAIKLAQEFMIVCVLLFGSRADLSQGLAIHLWVFRRLFNCHRLVPWWQREPPTLPTKSLPLAVGLLPWGQGDRGTDCGASRLVYTFLLQSAPCNQQVKGQ